MYQDQYKRLHEFDASIKQYNKDNNEMIKLAKAFRESIYNELQ
jgi:hypothetical protein